MNVDDLLREFDDLPNSKPAQGSSGVKTPLQTHAHSASGSQVPEALRNRSQPQHITQHPTASAPNGFANYKGTDGTKGRRSSLDMLLKDLEESRIENSRYNANDFATSELATKPSLRPSKCLGLYLGGANFTRGRNGSTVGGLVCCDRIRCTKCDFQVSCFMGKEWARDVEYLFFRNNFPTDSKLAPKLLSKPGSCAYCCQCSWFSAVSETRVDYGGDLRWVCAGH